MAKQILQILTDKKLWLAPLAGYSDQAFRLICKDNGADVVVSEMINANGLRYGVNKVFLPTDFNERQHPFGIQFLTDSKDDLLNAVYQVLAMKPAFIDLNLGCPMRKIVGKGGGSALLKNPQIAVDLVKSVKPLLSEHHILLSAKIRSGWDDQNLNFLELALSLQEAGIDFITIHPRTKMQHYQGLSNWEHIRTLKKNLSIPVVGNGDIRTAEDALRMFDVTGCDSVMIGRGCVGKPWLFNEIQSLLTHAKKFEISSEQKIRIIRQHYQYALDTKPKRIVLREMKPHLVQYAGSFTENKELMNKIRASFEFEEIMTLLEENLQ